MPPGDLDLYIDGADEATADGVLIKGGGAALTREKIVAAASAKFVCIIDDTKLVEVLGGFPSARRGDPDGALLCRAPAREAGGQPGWREGVVTDNGNVILDVHGLRLDDPAAFESAVESDRRRGDRGSVRPAPRRRAASWPGDARREDHHILRLQLAARSRGGFRSRSPGSGGRP